MPAEFDLPFEIQTSKQINAEHGRHSRPYIMRIAEVIGRVTLCRAHPSLKGAKYVIGVPLTVAGIQGSPDGRGEPFVIYDALGAGQGALLGVSEGTEAAAPFLPEIKPVDAYNAAILDTVEVV